MLGGLEYRSIATAVRRVFRHEKLRQTGIISANADFGIVGDGLTDNWVNLRRLRDFMRTNDRPWIVIFEPGVYLYSLPHWLKGVYDVTLMCAGSTFKCTQTASAWSFDKMPLTGNFGVFNDSGYPDEVGDYSGADVDIVLGYKFGTVEADAVTITLVTAAEAANFAAGDRVILHGYPQQDNTYPPNPRYHERNEVLSVNVGAGTVTLKNKLKYSYHEDWHDFTRGGAPRIQNLDRDDFRQAARLVINGGYFQENPNFVGGDQLWLEGYDYVELNNVKADEFIPTVSRMFQINNCDFASMEGDKVVESIVINGGRVKDLGGFQAVDQLVLTGNVHLQGNLNAGPARLIMEGAVVSGVAAASAEAYFSLSTAIAVPLVDIRSATLVAHDSARLAFLECTSPGGVVEDTFTVDSVSSDTKVLVLCANAAAFEALYKRIRTDFTYQLQDGSNRVRVTKIYDEDATHVAIEGEWAVTPIAAQVYRGARIKQLRVGNVQQVGPYAGTVRMMLEGNYEYDDIHERNLALEVITITDVDLKRQASGGAITGRFLSDFFVRGYVRRVEVTVITAYTGGGTGNLYVQQNTPAVVNYAVVNTATAGKRVAHTTGYEGGVTGDTLAAIGTGYCNSVRVQFNTGVGVMPAYADPTELPRWIVSIEVLKPR